MVENKFDKAAAEKISDVEPSGIVKSTYFAYTVSPGIETRRFFAVSPESAIKTRPLKIPLYTPVSTTCISRPLGEELDQTDMVNLSAKLGYSFLFISLSWT